MELIESWPEIDLRPVDISEPSRGEEPAERLGEMKLFLKSRDGGWIRRLRDDPAMLWTRSRNGCSHGAKGRATLSLEQASFARVQEHTASFTDLGGAAPRHGAATLQRDDGIAVGARMSA
jgi:hypothetical protein